MTAVIRRFKRKPHAVIEGGPSSAEVVAPRTFSVELVDDEGRHRSIWSGPDFADALAEAIYLDCPIILRLGTLLEGGAA